MGQIKFNGVLLLMGLQIFLVATTTGDETCESDRKMEEQCRLHNYKTVKPLLDYFRQVRNEIEQSETKEKQISDLMEKYHEIVKIHETFKKEAALLNEYKNKVIKGENDLQLCQNKVDKSESEINSQQNTILKLKEQLTDKSTNLENCQVQLKSLNSRLIKKDENIKRFSEIIKNNTKHQKTIESQLEKSKSLITKHENNIQLCRSESNKLNRTSENFREEQKKIQLKFKENETKLIDKVKDKSTNLENCQVQLKSVNSSLIEKNNNIKRFSEIIKNNTEHQKTLELKLEKSKSILIKHENVIQLYRSEINDLNRISENIKEEQKKIQLKLSESETKLIDKVKENQSCQSELNKLSTTCPPFGDYSGAHQLKISGIGLFNVLCDSQLAGPGWIVIQQRVGGDENFTRDWATYRKGFGSFESDFFLGLEKIHRITSLQRFELYIHLVALDGRTYYACYDDFKISDEDNGYALSLGKFNGTINKDSMRYSDNMKFTTFDHDNDEHDYRNCAVDYKSGWWYKHCSYCYLNAPYPHWWSNGYIYFKEVKMLIRPKEAMKK